jgi:hypothetical protein
MFLEENEIARNIGWSKYKPEHAHERMTRANKNLKDNSLF